MMQWSWEHNEIIVDEMFAHMLKAFCVKYLGMIPSKEIVLDKFIGNGKWLKNSFQYISVLQTAEFSVARGSGIRSLKRM